MIYKINDKYYVKVGYEYNEIEVKLDENGEVVLIPKKNRIEADEKHVTPINFLAEKENLKKRLSKSKVEKSKNYSFEDKPKINKNNKKWSNW